MHAAIVKLNTLTDAIGTSAQNHSSLLIRGADLRIAQLVRLIVILSKALELGSASVNCLKNGDNTQFFTTSAYRVTARTYPDVQSLLLLSVAFDISIDELIKGDVETMEESVRKADHSLIWMYAAEMLLTVIAIVALFFALDSFIEKNTTSGFACLLVFAATFATALGLSFAVKKEKVRNNILTYQEILAFCAGEEPNRTSRYNAFVRKHKSAHDMLLVMLSAIFGAALVVVLRFIF